MASQTLALGAHAASVQSAVARFQSDRVLPRLWNRDAALWSADPAIQATIRNRLGWLSIADAMSRETASLRRFAEEICAAGLTHTALLGMGGSGLFSEVCRFTFGTAPGHLQLTVLDTTDPTAVRRYAELIPLKQLLAIVSSKSGSTSEISALSSYFYHAFSSVDRNPGAHCIAITDAGTSLETQAKQQAYRRVFVHGPGAGAEVGGRFSAITFFGLIPAALMGVDVDRLLASARQMFTQCGPTIPLEQNQAAQLGAVLAAFAAQGRNKFTLVCPPALASFGTWIEQLIAESLGKSGQGVVPICGEPLREPSAYVDDRFFVELQLASEWDAGIDGKMRELSQAGFPVVRIKWNDRYELGGEVAKWFLATAAAGCLMKLNPFDEPNVKESKDRTKALLDQYVNEGALREERSPTCSDGDITVYGQAANAKTLPASIEVFFRKLRPTDYVALLSFLPRIERLDRSLMALRESLSKRLGSATMLGFGPRYLHSTGQLYKGGPDGGVFLFFTADEREDLAIPEAPFTFGVLKQAQALGDFQAMLNRKRRILRFHLRGDPERAFAHLAKTIEEVVNVTT